MTLPLLLLLGILHILLLLPQCLCHHQGITTRSLNQLEVSSHGTVPKLISPKVPNTLASSTTQFATNTFNSRRLGVRHRSSRHARIARRGLLPDISNFASNTFGGLFGNSNSQANGPPAQSGFAAGNSRQVTYPQDSQPFPSGDSRALMNGQPNALLPHPTQLPSSSTGSSKAQLPATTSTSLKAQATSASSHSHATTSSAPALTASSAAPSPTDEPTPPSAFERFGSLYKPSNRFAPLAALLTVVFILGFLVSLMAILKCVAHKKRFANKKDYPTGFPWVEPGGSEANRTSSRQGLVHTKSYTSTRNSMTSSLHFSSGRQLGPEGQMTPNQTEYQLNELGSDVYSNYAWAATEMDLEKTLSSPSDEGPSSAATEDSNHVYTANQERDQWHTESLDDGPCFIRGGKGELLEDSKVLKLGHP
ncbi:hypothetical protein PtA15_9A213 [Puccinia triticina]|uniref:Uncharacterized protein n=1 Tax=Puccinia triticina TaxID=208348 RepID=A0ABY7CS44_9BASI|nr:uncharacterized protein PtA15_9A213 [Puccinia triticina]WAQ88088.1 hypothetical protein PtA15_9A213 [Puccinia triticina]